MKRREPEQLFTVAEAAAKLRLHPKTVLEKLKAREFGDHVLDLAKKSIHHEPRTHDYRIPASGLVAWTEARRVFLSPEELGIDPAKDSHS